MGDAVITTTRTVDLIAHEYACEQPRETALEAAQGNTALGEA